jgi:hypothetical protein
MKCIKILEVLYLGSYIDSVSGHSMRMSNTDAKYAYNVLYAQSSPSMRSAMLPMKPSKRSNPNGAHGTVCRFTDNGGRVYVPSSRVGDEQLRGQLVIYIHIILQDITPLTP